METVELDETAVAPEPVIIDAEVNEFTSDVTVLEATTFNESPLEISIDILG